MNIIMAKGLSKELTPYVILIVSLIFLTYFFFPQLKIISATPFVYEPDTYNVTEAGTGSYVLTSVFQTGWNVTVRANISANASVGAVSSVTLDITDPNSVVWLDDADMIPTGITCEDTTESVGWVTPDSVYSVCGEGVPASNTIDDNIGTTWEHAVSEKHEIVYDMGRPVNMSEIRIHISIHYDMFPCKFDLYVSNDTDDWGTKLATINIPAKDNWNEFDEDEFTSKTGRYINLTQIETNTSGTCGTGILTYFMEFDATQYKCEVYEYNFTLNSSHPGGTWAADVVATDSDDTYTNETEFTVNETTPPTFSNNQTNTTVVDFACNFTLNWTDETGFSGYIFSANNSGTWRNASWTPMTGTSNTSWNVTTLNSTVGTVVGWKFYANDTNDNWNVSYYNITTTFRDIEVNLTNPDTSVTTKVGQNTTFNVNATVDCNGGECGLVQGYVRYNASSIHPDTVIDTTDDTPFYINESTGPGIETILTHEDSYNETGTVFRQPAIADIDDDGTKEIVVGSEGDKKLYVFNYTGGKIRKEDEYGSTAVLGDLILVDVDDDGTKEIVVVNAAKNITVYNHTDHNIQEEDYYTHATEHVSGVPAVADVDNDGTKEIVVITRQNGNVLVLNHTNHDTQLEDSYQTGTNIWAASSPSIADVDNDGTKEIAVGNGQGNDLFVFNHTNHDLQVEDSADFGGTPRTPSIADVDGDGTLEIVVSISNKRIYVLNHTNHDLQVEALFVLGNEGDTPSIADVDNDGTLEIVVQGDYSTGNDNITVLNHTNHDLQMEDYYAIGNGVLKTPSIADVDNDGFLEIVTYGYFSEILVLNHTNHELQLEDSTPAIPGGYSGGEGLLISDLDNDGILEIFGSFHTRLPVYSVGYYAGHEWQTWEQFGYYVNHTGIQKSFQGPINPLSCGSLSDGQSCQLNWAVNATGALNSGWEVGVLFNSTHHNITGNHTDNATVRITENIKPRYWDNSTNSTIAGEPVDFRLRWTDNVGLGGYIFSINNGTEDWIKPDGFEDPESGWDTEANAYDGDIGTAAEELSVLAQSWSSPLNLTLTNSISVNEISFVAHYDASMTNTINITLFNGTNRIDVYEGSYSDNPTWNYITFKKINNVDKVQVMFYNSHGSILDIAMVYEFNFSGWTNDTWNPMTGTGNWSNVTKVVNSTVGATIKWRIHANDTSDNWNTSDIFSFVTTSVFLDVSLITPTAGATTTQAQNTTFNINASITCRNSACGNVYGTVQYNGSSLYPDIPINSTKGDKPFYNTSGEILQSCGNLNKDDACQLNWTVNATGDYVKEWKIGVLFNSSLDSVADNHTNNATIKIVECTESWDVTWSSIDFGNLNPNTLASSNPAPGNTNKLYNITNLGTCTLKVWIKGSDLENTTYSSTIEVGNFSWSNRTNSYDTSYNMTENYVILNSSFTPTIKNITTYYWLAVPPVYAGKYNGTMTLKENTTQQSG